MDLDKQVKTLEEQKIVLEKELKALKIKQAMILKIKQLTDDISKLNSNIKIIETEVNEGEK